ncbi:NADPH-dependent 7-cyano-7-deazaguanine reductase QueF [Rickettsia endosymbiont of Halotydeus destructor]|uniref:NADPH-dependent 7-cyano-7-deazaguanine reductase QueF n=1 Tax=Rickettsia endosymbiont of Halotydeus destructor TaxID=2996754 RepID=UPI003BAE2445
MNLSSSLLNNSVLGKKTNYGNDYDPTLLFKIPRITNREALGLNNNIIPFFGVDIWNAYEISWLNPKGKPCVATAIFYIPTNSPNIVESKSVKLYLNSFNNAVISSMEELQQIILQDLSTATNAQVSGRLLSLNEKIEFEDVSSKNIDDLDVECNIYDHPDSKLIEYEDIDIEEEINSNLLKSNCLVTNQPDWGTIIIKYKGKKLRHDSMLKYLVSFRNCNEFAEQCAERIFMDIKNAINPTYLSIYIRYTRRGGIDICPYRSTDSNYTLPSNKRLIRQ